MIALRWIIFVSLCCPVMFVGRREARSEVRVCGLRSPWRFSFDRGNGRFYLADVGQDAVEEINVVKKGNNYGWNVMEGDICTPGVNKDCKRDNLAPPIFTYRHPEGSSITGGYVYRGKAIPGLCGVYLFADYVTRKIWWLRYNGRRVTQRSLLLETPYNISTFGEDSEGGQYVAAHRSGIVLKIVAAVDTAEEERLHL